MFWNLATDFGEMNLSFRPAGTEGFADLQRDAVMVSLNGRETRVASLRDIIRSKDAANRDKDRRVLPLLRRLLDDQEG